MNYWTTKDFKHCLIVLCGFTIAAVTFVHYAFLWTCCTELTKDCLSCQIGVPAYKFCWDNPGRYDCGYQILVAITTDEKRGYVKFMASTIEKYLHLNVQDIVILDNNSNEYDENDLLHWFGNETAIVRSEKKLLLSQIQRQVLQFFVNSKHEVLVLIDSNMILHKDWQDFVNSRINDSKGVLPLCETKNQVGQSYYCSSVAMTKNIAELILDHGSFSDIKNFTTEINKATKEIPLSPTSVVFPLG